jgi:hypothetical protein
MKSFTKNVIALALIALLVSCGGNKLQNNAYQTPVGKQTRTDNSMNFPPITKLPGQWTVEDVLLDYGDYSVRKLSPYFKKAKVPYPPKEVVFVALKEERKLELWAKEHGEYRFIRDYEIQAASGVSGPKLRQGDQQVPEGIYRIEGLNPNSHYHLSMKLNYPNNFDLYHADQEGRFDPGGDIFIHGKAASIGCLAMGDDAIEELFVLTANVGKENVKVVIAPRDPRVLPLDTEVEGLPEWTGELYDQITSEIQVLSPPVRVSKNVTSQHSSPQ